MEAGGGGGEVLTARELAMEGMDPQPGVFSEAEILRMEIASLVNLLREKQSDVLSLDPEIVRKITSLRSEIACQKLARERKALLPEKPRRRKKFSAVRRVGQKKEIMADPESMDLLNSDTQSVSSQVSCISEQMPEHCEQKEIDSEKIKPASRFESNFEHVYLPYGGEDEGGRINGQFSCILEQAEALCDDTASMATILGKISTPLISYHDVSNLFHMAYKFLKISRSIYDYTCNADKQMADQYAEDQRTKEYVEMTDQVDKGKSSTHCLNQRNKEEVDGSVTDLTMDLCKSNMETHQMAAGSQMTDDKDEHFVAAELTSGLPNQMTVHCYDNQSTVEYLEMIDLTVDKGESSTETHALRMMDQGKSSIEGQSSTEMQGESSNEGKSSTESHVSRMIVQGKSSSEGQSSTETRALRLMDQGKSSSEGQSSTEMQGESSSEDESSTETHASRMMMDQGKKSSFRMVLDSDEKGMPNLCRYYEMLECEDEKEEDEEMTAEGVRMYNKFQKELLEMEAGLRKDREQDQKDALRWEQDQIDTPSCYTMDPIPFSLQDEAEETDEAEEMEFTKSDMEEMEMEDKLFALERKGWESAWGDDCGDFEDRTVLSPMHFTHCTPGLIPYAARTVSTLQIYSVKIVGTDGKLKLPLHVYGIVAARDAVDYNRNILFSRRRENCQKLTPEDPFLRLTGPSRAIVAVDHVDFEVQLKVKGSSRSCDRALMSDCFTYSGGYHEGLHTMFSSNCFCTVELSCERLTETVQATILSARVVEGVPWPFEYGGRIMCSSPPQEVMDSLSRQVVLVDSHRSDDGGEMPMGSDGYLDLSRHVVSVELEESLQFVIQAYSHSGDAIARQGSVKFRTKYCNISRAICEIGDSKVEITVAWSPLVKNKRDILLEGHV